MTQIYIYTYTELTIYISQPVYLAVYILKNISSLKIAIFRSRNKQMH